MSINKDLETCTVSYVETSKDEKNEEEKQLLEDRSGGRLIYFLSSHVFGPWSILNISIAATGVALVSLA